MSVEQQYIDLFSQTEAMICRHSAEVLNAPRAAAFADFERLGFPTRKVEKYKYTDVSKFFEPDYGLNLNRLDQRNVEGKNMGVSISITTGNKAMKVIEKKIKP